MELSDIFGKKQQKKDEKPEVKSRPDTSKLVRLPSKFIRIHNSRFLKSAVVGITPDMNNREICVELVTGSVTKIGYSESSFDDMLKELRKIDAVFNIDIKEP